MIVSLTKVDVKFECPDCKHTVTCNIAEAVENGIPYCENCNGLMDISECEVDIIQK